MVLGVVLLVDVAAWALGDEFEGGVTDGDGEAEGEIEHAALTAVLEARACEADGGFFVADCAVDRPAEDGEGARANLAFKANGFFDHLDVGVGAEAGLAHGGEVGFFPAGAVDVGFGGHGGGGCLWEVGGLVMLFGGEVLVLRRATGWVARVRHAWR